MKGKCFRNVLAISVPITPAYNIQCHSFCHRLIFSTGTRQCCGDRAIPARYFSIIASEQHILTPGAACRVRRESGSNVPTTSAPPATDFPPSSPVELHLLEGDVVEYRITEEQRRKGQLPALDTRTLGIGVVNQFMRIHPLCRRSPGSPELFFDEEQDALEENVNDIVVRVINQVWYQQRCIEDRKINPHGEEAEDMYILEEGLSPGCGPAERF